MSTPEPSTSPSSSATAHDLARLDSSLSPLRRVLRYAAEAHRKGRADVRYLGVIGLRHARLARAEAPEAAHGLLDELVEALDGFDTAESEDQEIRVLTSIGAVRRLDQLLGLPLPVERRARVIPDDDDGDDEDESDESDDSDQSDDSDESDDRDDSDEDGADDRRSARGRGRSRKKRSRNRKKRGGSSRSGSRGDEEASSSSKSSTSKSKSRASKSKSSKSSKGRSSDAESGTYTVRYGDPVMAGGELSQLEGVGPYLAALEEAGITGIDALLNRVPTGEDVVQPVLGAGRLTREGRVAVGGRVRARSTHLRPDGTRETRVRLKGAGYTEVRFDGGAPGWVMEELSIGARTVMVGRAVAQEGVVASDTPPVSGSEAKELDVDDLLLVEESSEDEAPDAASSDDAGSDATPSPRAGRPTFALVEPELASDDGKHAVRLATYDVQGVPEPVMRDLVRQVLVRLDRLADPLPGAILKAHGLEDLGTALTRAHSAGSRASRARARLAFDESLLANLALLWPRYQGSSERGLSHNLLHSLPARVLQHVEAELTDEQQAAFEDVKRDLRAQTPMRRVLTGEVGAGKGLVALLSAVLVAENKHQVMILAPDQATAEQRYAFTEPLLRELGLVARLYTEPPSRAQRDAIKRGEVHVLFGPTSLLDATVDFRRLGLVIAGERDVFGSVPAKVETLRSPRPDLLVITSTPVPQPVLLAAYPTFDHTVLRHLPGQPVPAQVLGADKRGTAYGAAAEAIERGEQAVVVFPMSRGADVLDVREALHVVSSLESHFFPGKRIKLFHGAMSRDERYRVYNDFRDHRLDVLVATTHFEAGPAVGGVSVVIIEQADRMGLSRMHRVRGHLSVSHHSPRCWLITGETPDAEGVEQVERFARVQDGFSVSAQELALRGLDAMVSSDSPQAPRFGWLDEARDIDTLLAARADARALLDKDPGLRRGPNLELARYLKMRWEALVGTPCPVQVSPAGSSRRRRRRRRR